MTAQPALPWWQDLTPRQIARLADEDGVAILPLAAIEQHGEHLPLSTDLDIALGLLAAPAMGRAAALRGLSRGRRGAAFSACGRGCWLGFGIVCLILCLGAWIELRLSPFLLRALLERFF